MKGNRIGVLLHAVLSLALLGLATFGAVRPAAAATIIYVKASASGSNSGTSWADAYTSLQSALTTAVAGQQIWVAKGTYRPGVNRGDSFNLVDNVAVYGGFAGTESQLAQRKPLVNVTILSGDIGTIGVASDNSYHVVFAGGVFAGAVLDGFKVTGGNANSIGLDADGGGLLADGAMPTVRNIVFTGNSATKGGGVYANSSNVDLRGVTFLNNKAGAGGGGGLYSWSSGPDVENVTFKGNTTSGQGGAIYASGSSVTLVNVTVTGNSATGSGDGIYSTGGGGPFIRNSIFWADGTQEVVNGTSTSATIANSIVKGGCPGSSSCTGLVNADPKLGALQNNGGYVTTMALGGGSAAIDRGNNSTCMPTDARGIARPQGPKCDMGAYEVKVASFVSSGAYDGWVLESGVNSGMGGSLNSAASTLRVGDDSGNRQYRSVLSFNTSSLPDAATVVVTKVKVEKQSIVGTNPFTTHGGLLIDVVKPFFGSAISLVASDFQAAATVMASGGVSSTPSGAWYTGTLNSSGRAAINKTGTTQLRLRFSLHSNGDNGADYLAFYSGDAAASTDWPSLFVYYNP